jgi:ERCC4-type nuclease
MAVIRVDVHERGSGIAGLLSQLGAEVTVAALNVAAIRSQRPRRRADRPVYSQRPKQRDSEDAAEAFLAAVPGLSTSSARALLGHFGPCKR